MSDPEYDLYLDGTDDLVQAYLEKEHVRPLGPLGPVEIDKEVHGGSESRSRKGEKRGRERSGSGSVTPPPSSSFGPRSSEGERSGRKKNRGSGRACVEPCGKDESISQRTKTKTKTRTETKTKPSSASIIITEPPAAWPPSHMTAIDSIKRAHSDHRKYLLSLSSLSSRPSSSLASTSTSTSTSNLTVELKPNPMTSPKGMMTIHPSLTSSSQSTLKPVPEPHPCPHTSKPIHSRPKFKFKTETPPEDLTGGEIRDERGNLTIRGKRALDDRLLGSLGTEGNVITNSDLYSRTTHFITSATGHQVSNRGGAKYSISTEDYFRARNRKLKQQFTAVVDEGAVVGVREGVREGGGEGTGRGAEGTIRWEKQEEQRPASASERGGGEKFTLKSKIFAGCTMWLNGYSGGRITDLELKKLFAMHGGNISLNEGTGITHVLVCERLSGLKAERFLRGASKAYTRNGRKKVVLVNWVLDSIEEGRKLSESMYSVIKNDAQPTIVSRFGFVGKCESTCGTRQIEGKGGVERGRGVGVAEEEGVVVISD